jgi:predicted nucleotidyltransferase
MLNVSVPDDVRRRLEASAGERGVTVEELAGELLAQHVPDIDVVPRRRRLALAGIGASKHGAASGVIPMLAHAFGDNPAIDEVFIFGSWAARCRGEQGPPPNDVDVAVVSNSLTRFDLAEARVDLENESKLSINLFVFEDDNERLHELRSAGVSVCERRLRQS